MMDKAGSFVSDPAPPPLGSSGCCLISSAVEATARVDGSPHKCCDSPFIHHHDVEEEVFRQEKAVRPRAESARLPSARGIECRPLARVGFLRVLRAPPTCV